MDKIIERTKPSMNFVEQLQDQIQLCREAMSDPNKPLTPRIESLEGLLWAKLKDNIDYQKEKQRIEQEFREKCKKFPLNYGDDYENKQHCLRNKSKEQFRAIMVFIDKKGYMPFGVEND